MTEDKKSPAWHKPYYRWLNYLAGPIVIAASLPNVITRGVFYSVKRFLHEPPTRHMNGCFIALLAGILITVFGWLSNMRKKGNA